MSFVKMTFQVLRRGLIWLLIGYCVIFVGHTITNLVTGGPSAVIVWYRHIARAPIRWNWVVFLCRQLVILAVTVTLCLFGRNRPRRTGSPEKP
jgi:hypothetical protein